MATELASAEAYDAWIAANARGIVHFWAPWCEPCAAMDVLLETLAKRHPDVAIARCDAEAVEAVAARENVSAVPFFVFARDGRRVDAVEGADAATVTNKTRQYFPANANATTDGMGTP